MNRNRAEMFRKMKDILESCEREISVCTQKVEELTSKIENLEVNLIKL